MFYVDGTGGRTVGGTGNTFLYKTIIKKLKTQRKTTLAVAWTCIASTLLPGGLTVHRAFKLPLTFDENTVAGWPFNHRNSLLVRNSCVIIWDEASMANRLALEAVDRYFRDLMNVNDPMGEKVVFQGGDFRQRLPVLVRAHRTEIINPCIKSSSLWRQMQHFKLTVNIKRSTNGEFAE